jgi:cystathionine beta-lyase
MKYDFDRIIDRRNTGCYKWWGKDDELPMWVADMDFPAAPEILDAMQKRLDHGVFGYTGQTDAWYRAYMEWWKSRHHFDIEKDWLLFSTGVIPSLSSIVRKLTTPAEQVLVMTPVYNHFFTSIENNGRNVLECPLVYEDGHYHIDEEDLEKKLADPQTTMMILCNPQNPTGMIWDRDTLERIGWLCREHRVLVISDEIHCDLVDPGKEYIPFASVSGVCRDNSITCVAPTKTFNIAGLQTSALIVPNEALRHKVQRALNTDEVAEPNVFATVAAEAAYTGGAQWLDELRGYIYENKRYVSTFLADHLPELYLLPSEATYLLWIDCGSITTDSRRFAAFLRKETGLFVSNGTQYRGNGNRFIRVNIACPKSLVEDGMVRLAAGVAAYKGVEKAGNPTE